MHLCKKRSLALLVAAACNTALANESGVLKAVVVAATRNATEIEQIPATVTSVNRKALDRALPSDEADLFRGETDIAFARDLRRHSATRVNIRGIEDNRVRPGDTITLTEKGRSIPVLRESLAEPALTRPEWIAFNEAQASATVARLPKASEVPFPIEVQHVVEYYAVRM